MKLRVPGVRLGKSQCRKGRTMASVLSDVNQPVENVKITAAQMATDAQRRIGDISGDPRGGLRKRGSAAGDLRVGVPLFQPVVRRLAGDDYVVHVTLAQACRCDANETAALLQFFEVCDAAISHAAAQAADELVDEA